jgi:hypothetical protein
VSKHGEVGEAQTFIKQEIKPALFRCPSGQIPYATKQTGILVPE